MGQLRSDPAKKEIILKRRRRRQKEKQGISKKVEEDLRTSESYVLWERANEGEGKVPRRGSHWGRGPRAQGWVRPEGASSSTGA